MKIRPIKTKKDYREALAYIEKHMDSARPETAEGDIFDTLVTLVDVYEREQFPMDAPDPVAAIKFRMEQMGAEQTDLAQLLGSRSRSSEILNRKRTLSLAQARTLHKE